MYYPWSENLPESPCWGRLSAILYLFNFLIIVPTVLNLFSQSFLPTVDLLSPNFCRCTSLSLVSLDSSLVSIEGRSLGILCLFRTMTTFCKWWNFAFSQNPDDKMSGHQFISLSSGTPESWTSIINSEYNKQRLTESFRAVQSKSELQCDQDDVTVQGSLVKPNSSKTQCQFIWTAFSITESNDTFLTAFCIYSNDIFLFFKFVWWFEISRWQQKAKHKINLCTSYFKITQSAESWLISHCFHLIRLLSSTPRCRQTSSFCTLNI